MTQQAPRESLLELYDVLARHQLRDAGAEVAAAIAHAVGTPLNVISGRAELIRHDPANALVQVARIEEQVKKLASGLRQLVDYLAVPEPAPAGKASDGNAEPAPVVSARSVLDDLAALSAPVARANGVEVALDAGALSGARVERWHALGTLSTLVSGALHHVAARGKPSGAPVRVSGSLGQQGVVFEVLVPGLPKVEGWQLEHFQARPPAGECSELHRTLSICAAVARGHGGRLSIEEAADASGLLVRFSCRNEAS